MNWQGSFDDRIRELIASSNQAPNHKGTVALLQICRASSTPTYDIEAQFTGSVQCWNA